MLRHVDRRSRTAAAPTSPRLGAVDYEDALAGRVAERDFGPRSRDDLYILYTGGTTGMPKGVVWRHEDVFFALGGGIDLVTGDAVDEPERDGRARALDGGRAHLVPIAPLMHGAAQWGVMGSSFVGQQDRADGQVRRRRRVAARRASERVNAIDDHRRRDGPAADRGARRAGRGLRPVVARRVVASTAAVFSPSVKDQFFERFPNLVITDAIGSSESGFTTA